MKIDMRVVSLGWGIQSFTLTAMAALGEIAPIDAAIHADTTHERSATYAFAERWTPWIEEHDVRVVRVQAPDTEPVDRFGGVMVPAFIENGGTFSRQCTDNWKRAPIRRWLQANRNRRPVVQLLGISLDEWQRAKTSDVKYITNAHPLIDMRMTRNDCVNWLERHGLEVPEKSSCVFCPFHRRLAWQEMKERHSDDFAKAIVADEMIRKVRPPGDLFVHDSRIPLRDVDLSTPEDHGQMAFWQETCESGYCWI